MKVLIKPQVTKPWSKEMYDYNDKVADLMKENIIKSMVSYSGSKGMTIFNDSKAVGYMISSTYLKVGG